MAIGLLESKRNEHPPGTVFLADDSSTADSSEAIVSRTLKHAKGANKHIVLVPQPSDDPNDPLVIIYGYSPRYCIQLYLILYRTGQFFTAIRSY